MVNLLYLPPELQAYKGEAFDVYLSGIQPVDCDSEWNLNTLAGLEKNYRAVIREIEDEFFIAKVILIILFIIDQ